jgi:hypothetical protein
LFQVSVASGAANIGHPAFGQVVAQSVEGLFAWAVSVDDEWFRVVRLVVDESAFLGELHLNITFIFNF